MLPPTVSRRLSFASLYPGLALALASIFVCLSLTSPEAGPVAAVFPPWWGRDRTLQAAASAGVIIRYGALPFIVVVIPDADGAHDRLRKAGSWLTLDPDAVGGCNASTDS